MAIKQLQTAQPACGFCFCLAYPALAFTIIHLAESFAVRFALLVMGRSVEKDKP